MSMKTTTSELIDQITEATSYPKGEVASIVAALTGAITANLEAGKAVAVHQLGTFKPSHRAARMGRNPKTGEALQIAASTGASFSAAKALKDALNA